MLRRCPPRADPHHSNQPASRPARASDSVPSTTATITEPRRTTLPAPEPKQGRDRGAARVLLLANLRARRLTSRCFVEGWASATRRAIPRWIPRRTRYSVRLWIGLCAESWCPREGGGLAMGVEVLVMERKQERESSPLLPFQVPSWRFGPRKCDCVGLGVVRSPRVGGSPGSRCWPFRPVLWAPWLGRRQSARGPGSPAPR